MFERITPEKAGISSKSIVYFYEQLKKHKLNTHAVIMARGNNIITEAYYAPFDKNFKHRMYSVSKSFVSIAIGLLIEEGRLSLDDKLYKFFPEYAQKYAQKYSGDENGGLLFLEDMTIGEALQMKTCMNECINWFSDDTPDRAEIYFKTAKRHMPGAYFQYDSPVSYMLTVIAERLCKKPFLEYMKEKFLDEIGFSKDSYCLKSRGGNSFGDSGVLCTARDLLIFARFVMNGGEWQGKRYFNSDYIKTATQRLTSNSLYDCYSPSTLGYGYQIWQAPNGGFAFVGMGDQLAICDREHDFITIINSDNQGNPNSRFLIYHTLYENIIERLSQAPLDEDDKAFQELQRLEGSLELNALDEPCESPFANIVNGREYELYDNPMGITFLRFCFDKEGGAIHYINKSGKKELSFGWAKNVFGYFPEEGYSDMIAGQRCEGNKYKCAAAAGWLEENTLHIKVQAIDKYFGILHMAFCFKGDKIELNFEKTAEAFFDEYSGIALGRLVK